jgi:DNA (cytosine-5)-methyltransferase 1
MSPRKTNDGCPVSFKVDLKKTILNNMAYRDQKNQADLPESSRLAISDQIPDCNPLQLISVFSGAGGMDHGFHHSGFRTIFSADNNESAVNTFNHNFPGNVSRQIDLGKTQVKKFLKMIELASPKCQPRGIIGGPPCQGVSRGNSQSKSSDPRNTLMTTYTRLLAALEERYGIDFFVFENVPDLQSVRNQSRYKTLMSALRKSFVVHEKILNAADFGVPQNRERLFIVGINKNNHEAENFNFPTGTNIRKSVRQAIEKLPPPTFFKRGITGAEISHHPNHWTMNPKSPRFTDPNATASGRSFRRLNWDQPSQTVAYGHREIHIHPNGTRRLSIFEAMLLQGFDPTFRLLGNLSAQVTQISNAVAPPVAFEIANSIKQLLYPGHLQCQK